MGESADRIPKVLLEHEQVEGACGRSLFAMWFSRGRRREYSALRGPPDTRMPRMR